MSDNFASIHKNNTIKLHSKSFLSGELSTQNIRKIPPYLPLTTLSATNFEPEETIHSLVQDPSSSVAHPKCENGVWSETHTHTHTVTHAVYILKSSTTMSAGIPGARYQGCNNTSEIYIWKTLHYFHSKLLHVEVHLLGCCSCSTEWGWGWFSNYHSSSSSVPNSDLSAFFPV